MPIKRVIVFLLFALLLLAGCTAPLPASDAAPTQSPEAALAQGYDIRPIDDIIDAELLVTNFAADGTATLPIHTAVPVACTVVFGETPAFGSLTLDQDMAGGTHSDHNPLLQNLDPDTEYYFRVQGVDDNGTLYLSDVMTFTTPSEADLAVTAAEEGATDNLASPLMGAEIVGASSAFGGAGVDDTWGAGSAFDGKPNTAWSSAGDGDAAWVEVALDKPANISRIEIQSRSMSDGTAITRRFTVTTDSGETFGPFDLPDASQMYGFDLDATAQTLRFDLVETTGGNTGLVDVVVYGEFVSGE